MKSTLPTVLALLLLITTALIPFSALAQAVESHDSSPTETEDDAPVERVARLSFVEGDVSFLREGAQEWAAAAENLPLLSGDQVYTAGGARAELQFGRGNYVRMSENTALTISSLTHTAAQLEVTEGVAIVRLERFGAAFDRFEVDTPNAALMLQEDGLYRVNVRGDDESEIIARRGSMEVTTQDGSFKVREGQRLLVDTSNGRLEIASDNSNDDWDRWSYDRDSVIERVVSAAAQFVSSYETNFNCFYGASELDDHGWWRDDPQHGHYWVPRVGAGWAPYRDGQWIWIPRIGWSWFSNEPWGWAPYHYGRWAYISGVGWAWVPGFRSRYNYGHRYYQWRPALVGFFNCPTPRGDYIGWYPLRPGERWRRPDSYRDRNDHSHLQYPSPRDGRRRPDDGGDRGRRPGQRDGVTLLPVAGFNNIDKTRRRPEAPGQDLSKWVEQSARHGLPVLTPALTAVAPVNEKTSLRRVVLPPIEIVKRPVVTRNRPADSQAGTDAPRERRLLQPRKPDEGGGKLVFKERRHENHDQGDQGGNQDSEKRAKRKSPDWVKNDKPLVIRPARPAESEQSQGDQEESARRKRQRSSDEGRGDEAEGNKNRSRARTTPAPDNDGGARIADKPRAEKPRDNNEQIREKRTQERPREDSNSDGEKSGKRRKP